MRGGIGAGDRRFRPRFVEVVDVWKDDSGMGPYRPRVALAHAESSGRNNPSLVPSRTSQHPLAWIWPMGRNGIGQ